LFDTEEMWINIELRTKENVMGIQPEGDAIKNAVKWIGQERKSNPSVDLSKLVEEAGRKFDLSPMDSEFLFRFVRKA
jgi:hypothetical protein